MGKDFCEKPHGNAARGDVEVEIEFELNIPN
jgi:hypothetical protein